MPFKLCLSLIACCALLAMSMVSPSARAVPFDRMEAAAADGGAPGDFDPWTHEEADAPLETSSGADYLAIVPETAGAPLLAQAQGPVRDPSLGIVPARAPGALVPPPKTAS